MATLPDYLAEQTEEAIMRRMLDSLPSDLDRAEGSYIWDALAPAAIELTLAAAHAREVLRRGFASTTFGDYLDLRCEEHGLSRKAAVRAAGQVEFTGAAGTVVPQGTRVATPASSSTGTASVEFLTSGAVTIGGTGSGYAPVEAVEAGAGGNIPAGAVSVIVTPVSGVTGVANPAAFSGGADREGDGALLERFLVKVRNPSAGGNKADYINWAGEVAGVGGVSVVPVKYGNGTVSVAVIDTGKQPAGQALLDSVLGYIAPPWDYDHEAETMTVGGGGTSIDATQPDDSGHSVKMEYSASGEGTIVHAGIDALLDRPGIWQARAGVKVSDITGPDNLLRVGVWNNTTGAWAKVSSGAGAADAAADFRAADLSLSFEFSAQQFHWNGGDSLDLRISRLQSDNATVVWVDQVKYRSTFSRDTGEGRAPVGAAVYVESAGPVVINVSAALAIRAGFNPAAVKSAAENAIGDYLAGIAFRGVNTPGKETENDVKYARIANAVLDTEGVEDYTGLLVNGGTANIAVGPQEVAVKGTVTFT